MSARKPQVHKIKRYEGIAQSWPIVECGNQERYLATTHDWKKTTCGNCLRCHPDKKAATKKRRAREPKTSRKWVHGRGMI